VNAAKTAEVCESNPDRTRVRPKRGNIPRRILTAAVLAALLVATSVTCDLFNPHATTRFDIGASVQDVFVRHDTLLVAAGDSGLYAFDISKPKAPRELLRADLGRDCRCVVVQIGRIVACVGTDSGVVLYHLANGASQRLLCAGSSQVVNALIVDSSDRILAATADGVTVFDPNLPMKFIPMSGEPTGLAQRDSRLFVSLRDWGVRVFNILPGDSFALDTLRLGRHNRAEGVTVSAGGYCIVSQGDSGVVVYYSPTPDTVDLCGGGGGSSTSTYAAAATDGTKEVTIYSADSSSVTINKLTNGPGGRSFGGEVGFAEFTGFTRRICRGGNGYVYTASGDAGVYVIRE
jgi:hypothetical protein